MLERLHDGSYSAVLAALMLEGGEKLCGAGIGVLHHAAQRLGFGDYVFNVPFL
jgi:hypothetical protein